MEVFVNVYVVTEWDQSPGIFHFDVAPKVGDLIKRSPGWQRVVSVAHVLRGNVYTYTVLVEAVSDSERGPKTA